MRLGALRRARAVDDAEARRERRQSNWGGRPEIGGLGFRDLGNCQKLDRSKFWPHVTSVGSRGVYHTRRNGSPRQHRLVLWPIDDPRQLSITDRICFRAQMTQPLESVRVVWIYKVDRRPSTRRRAVSYSPVHHCFHGHSFNVMAAGLLKLHALERHDSIAAASLEYLHEETCATVSGVQAEVRRDDASGPRRCVELVEVCGSLAQKWKESRIRSEWHVQVVACNNGQQWPQGWKDSGLSTTWTSTSRVSLLKRKNSPPAMPAPREPDAAAAMRLFKSAGEACW
jgi:hypothetical protein